MVSIEISSALTIMIGFGSLIIALLALIVNVIALILNKRK